MQPLNPQGVAGISQEGMKLMMRFLLGTTAIAAVLPRVGRMLVLRDAQGVLRDPWGGNWARLRGGVV